MSYKAKSKAVIVIKAKVNATTGNTSPTQIPISGDLNNNSSFPSIGGSVVAVAGNSDVLNNSSTVSTLTQAQGGKGKTSFKTVTYAVAPEFNDQPTQNGVSSYAKAQVTAAIGEVVSNNSLISILTGNSSSGNNQSSNSNSGQSGSGFPTPPPPSPTTFSQTDNLSPANIAFSDDDSKSQYVVLQREGLNVLRSEIIATMEFIPVASIETKNNSNLNQQDNNSEYQEVKIRNITKIIELHRQIREYMIAAAAKVYEKTFSSYAAINNANLPFGLNTLDKNFIVILIETFVKNWFDNDLRNSPAEVVTNLANNSQEADSIMDTIVTTIIQSNQNASITNLINFLELNNGEANLLFFKGLIEFFVYKKYIDVMISSYMMIDGLKDAPLRSWQINTSGVKKINHSDFGSNQLGPMYSKSLFKDNKITDFYENNLGISKSLYASDTSLLYQTLALMYGQLDLRDSTRAYDRITNMPEEEKTFSGLELKLGFENDLKKDFRKLTSLKIYDFVTMLGTGTDYVKLNASDDASNFLQLIGLNRTRFRDIGSEIDPTNTNFQTSEMLAAYAFDYCINLNSPRRVGLFGTGNNDSNFLFSSFGGLTYEEYTKKVLLGEFSNGSALGSGTSSRSGNPLLGLVGDNSSGEDNQQNNSIASIDTQQFFEQQTAAPLILGNQLNGQSYQDFYRNINVDIYESGLDNSFSTLKPGAEYVFDNLILPSVIENYSNSQVSIVNQDIKNNIETTFDHYKEKSTNFFSDLGSIFVDYNKADNFNGSLSKHRPIGKMSAKHRIKNLLTYLAEDIDNIISTPVRSIPLLATFLSQGSLRQNGQNHTEMQLKSFLAMFWGFADSSLYSQLINQPEGNESIEEKKLIISDLISGLAHFYNEEVLQNFLENRLDFDISQCLKNRGYHGGKYAYVKKSSAIFNAATNPDISEIDFNPNGFDKKFPVFLTDDALYYPIYPQNKTKTLPKFLGLGPTGESLGIEDLPDQVTLGNKYNMRENLNRSFTRSGTFLHDAFYNRDISNSSDRNSLGLYRLFEKSFSAIAADLDFSNFLGDNVDYGDLGLTTDGGFKFFSLAGGKGSNSILPKWSNDKSIYSSSLGPLKLKMHHKALVWYKWVLDLLATGLPESGVQMRVEVKNQNNGTFKIFYNKSQLRGIRDGLLEAADKIGSSNNINNIRNQIGTDTVYKRSKRYAVERVRVLADIIEKREKFAATTASLMINHAANIANTCSDENNIQFAPTSILSSLALSPLLGEIQTNTSQQTNSENSEILSKWLTSGLTLVNQKSLASMRESANKYFALNLDKSLLTTNAMTSNINKIKFMNKILSSEGYGFLESEKKGLKTIMNVGIPAGLINILQKNAYQETGNIQFLNSNYVCISVHKKNHLNINEFYDPKLFVFDTAANILDINPVTKEASSHLTNFSEEISLSNMLSEIEISRINYVSFDFLFDTDNQNYSVNKASLDPITDFQTNKGAKILMNHAISYALKEYLRLTVGINMSEDGFVMDLGRDTSSSTSVNVDQSKDELFQYILLTLNNAYPQVDEDPQLRNEVFRLTNIIKQMPPFSNKQNYIKTISPRKFDKIYSIFVNEKDFTLRDNPDIFTQPVNKNIGTEIEINSIVSSSKLNDYISQQAQNSGNSGESDFDDAEVTNSSTESQSGLESVVSEGLGDIFINRDASINKQINSYIRSLNENSPEVYNYSVNISLLPADFLGK